MPRINIVEEENHIAEYIRWNKTCLPDRQQQGMPVPAASLLFPA